MFRETGVPVKVHTPDVVNETPNGSHEAVDCSTLKLYAPFPVNENSGVELQIKVNCVPPPQMLSVPTHTPPE